MHRAEKFDIRSFITSNRFERLVIAVLPLAFIGSTFLNSIAFLLGLHAFDTVRILLTFGLLGLTALVLLARLLRIAQESAESRPFLLRALCLPAVFSVLYLAALITSSARLSILKSAVTNGLYLVLGCSAILIIYLDHCLPAFLRSLRIYSTVTAPLYLFYCVAVAVSGRRDIGTLDYMSIAYYALTLSIGLGAEILLIEGSKKPEIIVRNGCLYLLYSAVIMLSGTKGAILCAGFLLLVFFIYGCIFLQARKKLLLPLVSLLLLVFVLLSSAFFLSKESNRFRSFLQELSDRPSPTEVFNTVSSAQDILGKIIPSGQSSFEASSPTVTPSDIVSYYDSGQIGKDMAFGVLTLEEFRVIYTAHYLLNHTSLGYRLFLWTAAVREIEAQPLCGHGPMAFQEKYGIYPHNLFLELAADFGLIVTAVVLVLALFFFFKLLPLTKKSPYLAAFSIYVLAFLPQHMVSGTLYGSDVLVRFGMWILLTVHLTFPSSKKRHTAHS